jgi:hypothetical protein
VQPAVKVRGILHVLLQVRAVLQLSPQEIRRQSDDTSGDTSFWDSMRDPCVSVQRECASIYMKMNYLCRLMHDIAVRCSMA